MVDKVNETFGYIVQQVNEDEDESLSWGEFQHLMDNQDALAALEAMNVDAEHLVDMAEDFFIEDGSFVAVSFQDFMSMVLDLRGGQTATVKDVMSLGKRFNKKFLKV